MVDVVAELPRYKAEYLDAIHACWSTVEKRDRHSADYDWGDTSGIDEVGQATDRLRWARLSLRFAKAEVEKRRLLLARGGLH
jgi:hypothetical protein